MAEFARPATLGDLRTLVRALNEERTDYLLIGGWALYAHGFQRMTVDVDLLVRGDRATGEKVKKALLVLADRAAREIDVAWFEADDTIRVADEFVVDVMFRACGETYESLLPFEQRIDLDGVPVRTVNLEGLLRTKRTYREKDAVDRAMIEEGLRRGEGPTESGG